MNNFFEWVKKHPKQTVAITIFSALLIIFIIPIIINACFKFSAPCELLDPEWEASNVLAYYGSVLGFLGSVLLSALALYQNYEIKKESDAKQALLEKMAYEKDMPLFMIRNSTWGGNVSLLLINVSDNVAYDLEVGEFTVENEKGDCICKSKEASVRNGKIFGGEDTVIDFKNDYFVGEKIKLYFQMKCKDKFGNTHTYMVSSDIEDSKEFDVKYKITEIVNEKRG